VRFCEIDVSDFISVGAINVDFLETPMGKDHHRISVIVDDRESKNQVMRFLSDMPDVSVVVQRLSVGDYFVDHQLVVERKTLTDFARSIVDGRLFRQVIRLANAPYKRVMILEGTGKTVVEIGVGREAMQGALITISLILSVPVLRAKDPFESARLIQYAAKQIRSAARNVFFRGGYLPKGKRKRQLYLLQGLPGIGAERAVRLLDAFGSVEAVVTASDDTLQSVAGIGPKTARRIKWVVREPIRPYGVDDTCER
jgi:ERCC4-type nuclease